MEALSQSGLIPGKDIAVVGFDNIPEAEMTNPPLTTVSSFAHQIGSNAAALLYKRMLDVEADRTNYLSSRVNCSRVFIWIKHSFLAIKIFAY